MNRIITIYNRKGGVAKTITAFVIIWWLAMQGHKVCALDLDSQANLTQRLIGSSNETVKIKKKLIDIIISGMPIQPKDISTRKLDEEHYIDFIPASLNLSRIESKLPEGSPKEFFICDLLSEISDKYDYIIIDTPPAAELQSTSALIASTDVLIPSTPDKFGIDGVAQTIPIIERIHSNPRLNPALKVLGILVTKYPCRTIKTALSAVESLQDSYRNLVIPRPIREGNKVEKALLNNMPIIAYDPSYYVSQDYLDVLNTLFNFKK